MGEILSVVDFKQLKIENQQYLNKIDDKNQELLRLKLMAGNTMQVLNKYKVNNYSRNKKNCIEYLQIWYTKFQCWKCQWFQFDSTKFFLI